MVPKLVGWAMRENNERFLGEKAAAAFMSRFKHIMPIGDALATRAIMMPLSKVVFPELNEDGDITLTQLQHNQICATIRTQLQISKLARHGYPERPLADHRAYVMPPPMLSSVKASPAAIASPSPSGSSEHTTVPSSATRDSAHAGLKDTAIACEAVHRLLLDFSPELLIQAGEEAEEAFMSLTVVGHYRYASLICLLSGCV